MSLTVTHAKVSAIADDPAASAAGEVLPSDWNAAHTVSIGSLLDGDGSQVLVTKNTDTDNADNGDLRVSAHAYDVNAISGRWNQVYRIGYNMGGTNEPYIAGEPSMGISWESFYEQGGDELLEWHQSVFRHDTSEEVRFESCSISRSTYDVSRSSKFTVYEWLAPDDSNIMQATSGVTGGTSHLVSVRGGSAQSGSIFEVQHYNQTARFWINEEGLAGMRTGIYSLDSNFEISNISSLRLRSTSATTNEKVWDTEFSSSDMLLRAVADDYSSAIAWATVRRSGTSITGINLKASTVSITNGWLLCGAAIGSTNLGIGGLSIESRGNIPAFVLNNTSAATTERVWSLETGATTFSIVTRADAGGSGANVLVATRSGTAISSIVMPTLTLESSGTLVNFNRPSNGTSLGIKSLTELLTIAAAATSTTTIQMPANSIILAVPVRVTTAVTCTSTFTVGDAGSATRFSTAAVSKAVNSTDKGTAAGAYYNATARGIVITPDTTPSDATGRVRVTIYYIECKPPTS